MNPVTVPVTSERADYRVVVGRGLARRPADWLPDGAGVRVIVSCPPVWRALGQTAKRLMPDARPVLIPDGERAKTLRTAARLYDAFLSRHLDRTGAVIAVGGGVVGDVAGFAAATYVRGVPLIQVPTTLLAQVDSSVGGKVGVNLPAGKNLVGAFHPPSLVVCDPDVLKTLPRREFRAGMYEVVKYGVIASRALFDRVSANLDELLAHDPRELPDVIVECCRIKAAVVSQDERESGPRRVLNFGHTVGHALEGLTGYRRFRHGEAVAYGMLAAARLSASRGLLASEDEAGLKDVIRRLGRLPPVSDLRASRALDYISRDKKMVRGRLHFVLARGLGATEIVTDVTAAELSAAMRSIGLRG